ncbi:hypothetical protein KOY48_02475 [Candidatus Minimicrobia naudis]|uniref:Uncharacterized protein n=1 Tax=Candidatus Minimicrobia naudis TaxID=2841263 RepID=A0A8F1MBZ6_9BACT|nr:hypothetical protein KOY48_02475 [Candidatus Minimicrobia naudis]
MMTILQTWILLKLTQPALTALDDIRALREKAQVAPVSAPKKVLYH